MGISILDKILNDNATANKNVYIQVKLFCNFRKPYKLQSLKHRKMVWEIHLEHLDKGIITP